MGTVVEILGGGKAYMLEMMTADGHTLDVITRLLHSADSSEAAKHHYWIWRSGAN
ncbi:MAG: hypothetical protein IPO91_04385 [Chloroflexi bacterium]|nr:hypothetical protein [Chloroflexota bacterium]